MQKGFLVVIVCFLLSLTDTVGNERAPRKLNTTEKEMEASKHKYYHYIVVFIEELEKKQFLHWGSAKCFL